MTTSTALSDKLSKAELADLLEIKPRTLERWHAKRIGPPRIKIGRRVFYRRAAVDSWLLANEQAEVRA